MKTPLLRLALLTACALAVRAADAPATPATPAAQPPASAAKQGNRPPAPQRAPDAPGAPKFTRLDGKTGVNPPVDAVGNFVIGPEYAPAPELTVVPGVPVGRVEQFTMESKDSKFYNPGIAREGGSTPDPNNYRTVIVKTRPIDYQRTITVYIPAQYVAGTPAPFIVTHDGPALGRPDTSLPRVLDNLIAQKRVPVQLAIMIAHGGGDSHGSERGREYDTMSGKFAEFIEAEVLPLVEKNYGVTLSKDPEARAALGNSSGAAAAFTMAWYHSELYRRVISFSGTYVNQQWPFDPATPGGAWDYHERIIPNSPKQPIRLWMHVSDRDNFSGRDGMHDWVEANHRMARVLAEKGYRYQYVFSLNSGHGDRAVRAQTTAHALEWVWKDYVSAKR